MQAQTSNNIEHISRTQHITSRQLKSSLKLNIKSRVSLKSKEKCTQPKFVFFSNAPRIGFNYNSNSNQGESQDDQLPNGWFSVTDPASGDVYYCNEVTGETTWDKPTLDKATTDLLLSRTSNNVDPTVYEDDSVTSSKGY